MQMLTDRNRTSHAYNEETAEAILSNIRLKHHLLLKELEQTMHSQAEQTEMMLENTGLSREDVHAIQQTLRLFPSISEAILYGSRAKGNYRPGSDIDLTLKGNTLSHQDLQDIELALDDLLLPYKIDLSLQDQIDNPQLIEHIGRVGKLFYKATV